MQPRPFWIDRIESAWKQRPIVWLRRVRRSGKTTLCRSLPDVDYFDCERPRHRRQREKTPRRSWRAWKAGVVLDEVHRLEHPAERLKITHDHFPSVRIVATGSSTLAATATFKDTLAGHGEEVQLTPAIHVDFETRRVRSLGKRLLQGGLPPFPLADGFPEAD